ncbi:unnamed protein product [Closterium sp. NIES-64]|nr:unnamed protein product [Closterium sp. Naga37s-1]CAI5979750.1 unnamed protein product [Closterium sp. NIES-64]
MRLLRDSRNVRVTTFVLLLTMVLNSLFCVFLLLPDGVNSLPRHGGRPNFNDWVKSYRPDLASHQFDPIRIRAPRQIPEEYRDVHIPSEEELQMLAQFGHAHHASYYFNTKPAAAMAAAAEAAAGVGVGDQKP